MTDKTFIYRTPPMSGSIKVITYIMEAIPFLLVYFGFANHNPGLFIVAILFVLLLAGVWLWMRPTHYTVDSRALTIVWPLRKYVILRSGISGVRVLDKIQVKKELGFALRIGVGGLFGGFGLLWSHRRGLIRFYITRLDSFVMIDRRSGRPLLITVDKPHNMLKELATGDA
jgi:hypothetical protein